QNASKKPVLLDGTPLPNFAIDRDPAITKAKLFIPSRMLPGGTAQTEASPSVLPAGLSMAGCLAVGGLWSTRVRRRLLLGVAVPLAMVTVTMPLSGNAPPPIFHAPLRHWVVPIYSGDVDVYVDHNGDQVRLILPAKAL